VANNVEIKAKLADINKTNALAAKLTQSDGEQITQCDTFFHCDTGRLKLREFGDGTGQLISYHRSDAAEATPSDYLIYPTDSSEALRLTLSKTLGVRGVVQKTRQLYLLGRTRIHVDEVRDLGAYFELEVVLEEGEDTVLATAEANALMTQFNIRNEDLVHVAYIDLLAEKAAQSS